MSVQAHDAAALQAGALVRTPGESGGGIVLPYKGVPPRISPGVYIAPAAAGSGIA